MEKNISVIKGSEINEALSQSDREYLVGNLARPQNLQHIFDKDVEIGISDYEETSLDQPHFHPCISEYQYILKGEVVVFDLDNMEAFQLNEVDFYVVPNENNRVQLSKANLRILFVKITIVNDK